ncbi:hypothetical protein V2J09_024332 [Rumex salicifolius]
MKRHRFLHNAHPAEVSLPEDGSSGRRSGSSSIEEGRIEKEPLLDEDVKAAGGDWELDGILTIGTLAIDPLDNINLQDIIDEEAGEGFGCHDVDVAGNENPRCDVIEMSKLYGHKTRDVVKGCSAGHEIEEVEDQEIMYEKLTNLERTHIQRVTLLDLFMADELHHKKQGPADDDDVATKKKKNKLILYKLPAALGGRKGFSSKPKKALANGDVPPLKKLHRFMTRMMKKKIHPDMEARLQKKGQVKLNDDVAMGTSEPGAVHDQYYAVTESVYLLPPQGITV